MCGSSYIKATLFMLGYSVLCCAVHTYCAQQTAMAAAGFKLDTLLKLADVKGTDRKTSLLHFVLDQLLKESSAMHSLPHQLADVKAAANLQASAALFPAFTNFVNDKSLTLKF